VVVSAQAAMIIVDGDTIDVDGVRIWIVQIHTPETFGPRCESELILGLKAKKRLRELLDSGTLPRKHQLQ
jgi:endonuclease YncB( thermonuclease family)